MMLIFSSHWSSPGAKREQSHVASMAVVPNVVNDLVDDAAASNMGAFSNSPERELYIDQLLAEIESLKVRLRTRGNFVLQ